MERFLGYVLTIYAVAPLDRDSAEEAAKLAFALTAKGRQLHHLDTLIAGIAIARGATLVTRDQAFLGMPRLKTENWF